MASGRTGRHHAEMTRLSGMIKSADGSAGLLRRITKPTAWRGGVQKEEEEDARLMNR